MPIIAGITFFLVCLLHVSAAPPKPLVLLRNCSFVPTAWADGDSFRIKTAAGEEHTIRLYGADCMEWHIGDDTDARRLRAQRRYFGITEAASSKPVKGPHSEGQKTSCASLASN